MARRAVAGTSRSVLPDMQTLDLQAKQADGRARLRLVRAGDDLSILCPDSHMHPARVGGNNDHGSKTEVANKQETVIVLTVTSEGPLPDGVQTTVAQRTYSMLQAAGVRIEDVEGKCWYALEVREQ